MTTYKECIKCTFVDPLMKRFRKSEAPIFYNKPNSARQSKFVSLVNSGNCWNVFTGHEKQFLRCVTLSHSLLSLK